MKKRDYQSNAWQISSVYIILSKLFGRLLANSVDEKNPQMGGKITLQFLQYVNAIVQFTMQESVPVNLSFQTALDTPELSVITPLTVSLRLAQVLLKSTGLGFRLILPLARGRSHTNFESPRPNFGQILVSRLVSNLENVKKFQRLQRTVIQGYSAQG